jgi:hypothetical protein
MAGVVAMGINSRVNWKTLAACATVVVSAGAAAAPESESVKAALAKDALYGPANISGYKWGSNGEPSKPITQGFSAKQTSDRGPFKFAAVSQSDANVPATEPSVGGIARTNAYKWGILSSAGQSAYKWGILSSAGQNAYKWGILSSAGQNAYKWGVLSSAGQSAYKWGILSSAGQNAYKWGILSSAGQSAYKWGILSSAGQNAYKWGIL